MRPFDRGLVGAPDGKHRVALLEVDRHPGSGIGRFTRQLENAFADSGCEVAYLAMTAEAGARVSPRRTRIEKARFAASGAALARGSDVLVLSHLSLIGLGTILAGRRRHICLLYGHEAWEFQVPKRTAARTDFWSISTYTAQRFAGVNPAAHVAVLPMPVDPTFVEGQGDDSLAERELRAFPCGYAITVGRMNAFERYKGFDRVIRAFAELSRHPSHAGQGLVLVGDGTDRGYLVSLATELGVSEAVSFVGSVSDAQLVGLYRGANVMVLASQPVAGDPFSGEGFGLVFLEAAAVGTPSIGVDAAGSADAVVPAIGVLVPPDDDAALRRALAEKLLQPPSPDERHERAQWVSENHSSSRLRGWVRARLDQGTS